MPDVRRQMHPFFSCFLPLASYFWFPTRFQRTRPGPKAEARPLVIEGRLVPKGRLTLQVSYYFKSKNLFVCTNESALSR